LSGHAAVDAEMQIRGNDLFAQGRAVFNDLRYEIDTGHRETVDALDAALKPLTGFTLAGEIRGPINALEMTMTSELGQRLAIQLRKLLKTPLAAIDDTLRQELLDELDPNARAIESRVLGTKQWAVRRLESIGKPLKNSPPNAEKEKG
jgi:hypothetical protein